jgi:hypothetical protein
MKRNQARNIANSEGLTKDIDEVQGIYVTLLFSCAYALFAQNTRVRVPPTIQFPIVYPRTPLSLPQRRLASFRLRA